MKSHRNYLFFPFFFFSEANEKTPICNNRSSTHNSVINKKLEFEDMKTGAKGIKILPESLLAFASDITLESQIEKIWKQKKAYACCRMAALT